MINEEKSNSWKKFCKEAKTPYGQIYKAAFNKFFQPPNLHSTISNNSRVNNIINILTSLFQQDNEHEDSYQQKEIRNLSIKIRQNNTTPLQSQPFTYEEISRIIKTMPKESTRT
ncbi:hypothetical protein CEXT_764351 [Caerostris extrusa]|uniref:Uncharacterized protein n=1 Tax=Caerostris extrusa TaxID=172846 RepID=A0AAV4Q8Y4_CAEEX|nr:hypothetical protein CEXT_764351 [Caerostris extrusa]